MTVLHQGLCFINSRDREKKVFVSYFCSTPFPSLSHCFSLVDPCISEVIINLTDSIITFQLSALISSPPRRLNPLLPLFPLPPFPPLIFFFSLLYFLTHFLTSALYFFPKSFVLPLSFLRLFHLKKCSPAKMEGFHCVFLFDKLDNTCLDAL